MITHIIYLIPGKKVGCTANLAGRKNWYPEDTVIEVLEELHDKTDQEAGDCEWKWADNLGYRRGIHYTKVSTVKMSPEERKSHHQKMNKAAYDSIPQEKRSNRIQNARKSLTHEQLVANGHKSRELKAGVHGLTHEQLVANSRRLVEQGLGFHKLSSEQHLENSKRGGKIATELGRTGCQQRSICPHCGLEGNTPNLKRWHFDNCPQIKGPSK